MTLFSSSKSFAIATYDSVISLFKQLIQKTWDARNQAQENFNDWQEKIRKKKKEETSARQTADVWNKKVDSLLNKIKGKQDRLNKVKEAFGKIHDVAYGYHSDPGARDSYRRDGYLWGRSNIKKSIRDRGVSDEFIELWNGSKRFNPAGYYEELQREIDNIQNDINNAVEERGRHLRAAGTKAQEAVELGKKAKIDENWIKLLNDKIAKENWSGFNYYGEHNTIAIFGNYIAQKKQLFNGGYFFPLQGPTFQFQRYLEDEDLPDILDDELTGNHIQNFLNTLKLWAKRITERIYVHFLQFKDLSKGTIGAPPILKDRNNVRHIIRSILLNTGGVPNKAEVVREYISTLWQAERKSQLLFAFNILPKYIQRLLEQEQYHIAGYALSFLNDVALDKAINVPLFTDEEMTQPYDVKEIVRNYAATVYQKFAEHINNTKNTPQFLEDVKKPADTPFLTLFYDAAGSPDTIKFLPNPFGFLNHGTLLFDVDFQKYLQAEQLKFLTPENIQRLIETPAATFERLKRNRFVQMHLRTVFDNKYLTLNNYQYLLSTLSQRLTDFEQQEFRTKLAQIQQGSYLRPESNNPEQLKNIYAIYDYFQKNFKYENPPEPDFLFAGQPMAVVGGEKVRPEDYLQARDWLQNGQLPPRPQQQISINHSGLNTNTITLPASDAPALLPTGINKTKQMLNDTQALQAQADAQEPRTLEELAKDKTNRELFNKQNVLPGAQQYSTQHQEMTQKYEKTNNTTPFTWLWIAAAAGAGILLLRRN